MKWTDEHQQIFQLFKNVLIPPVLANFIENRETVISSDASRHGVDGVFPQYQEDVKPVAYVTRRLRDKAGWSVTECFVNCVLKYDLHDNLFQTFSI